MAARDELWPRLGETVGCQSEVMNNKQQQVGNTQNRMGSIWVPAGALDLLLFHPWLDEAL